MSFRTSFKGATSETSSTRSAFGTTAYGFFPLRAMEPHDAARLVHSADERISVDDLDAGVDLFRHVATTLHFDA